MKTETISIKCPFHMRDIPQSLGLHWNKETKMWEGNLTVPGAIFLYDFTHEAETQNKLRSFIDQFSCKRVESVQIKNAEPMAHQLDAASAIENIGRYGLFHEMGVGKTLSVIMASQNLCLKDKIRKVLILAPLSVIPEWEKQIDKFLVCDHKVIRISNPNAKIRLQKLHDFTKSADVLTFGLLNYDSLRTLYETLLRWPPDFIVSDESTRIKNKSAQATKCATEVADLCKYAVILTGTPIPNNIGELWSQIRFLSPSYLGKSYWKFVNRYSQMGGFQGRQIIGTQREEELSLVLSYFTSTVKKDQVLDLPPKTTSERIVELSGKQADAYKDAQDDFLFAVDAVTKASTTENTYYVLVKNALARLAFCQRISSGHVREEDGTIVRFKNSAKLEALKEIIEDAGKQPIVIFCRFTEDIDMISEELYQMKKKTVTFMGANSTHINEENLKSFQNGESQIFISQVQKGGYGIDLTKASIAIFFNNWFSFGTRDQAESRIHRKGQTRNCLYIDLIAKDTVDEIILDAIHKKESISKKLFGIESTEDSQ